MSQDSNIASDVVRKWLSRLAPDEYQKGTSYHYTSSAGLLGILQQNEIWASDRRFMNDTSEGTHYIEKLINVASELNDPRTSEYCTHLQSVIRSNRALFYHFSLSRASKKLSQFRAYGSYVIEFDDRLLIEATKSWAHELWKNLSSEGGIFVNPLEIKYSSDDQCGQAKADWVFHFSLLEKYRSTPEASAAINSDNVFCQAFEMNAIHSGTRYKHEGFEEEKEVRFICQPYFSDRNLFLKNNLIKFRAVKNRIVPYIPVKFWSDELSPEKYPIRRVICGPGTDKRSVELLCQTLPANIPVEGSEIPYSHS